MNNKYHIDLTPEEEALFRDVDVDNNKSDKRNPFLRFTFNKVFVAVLGVHLLLVGVIGSNAIAGALTNKTTSDSNGQTSNAVAANTGSVEESENKPTAESTPKVTQEPKQTTTPPAASKETLAKPSVPKKHTEEYTKTYTVKSGDTINSISRKYKLNASVLLKLNNIKNSDKIYVGQTLKFVK